MATGMHYNDFEKFMNGQREKELHILNSNDRYFLFNSFCASGVTEKVVEDMGETYKRLLTDSSDFGSFTSQYFAVCAGQFSAFCNDIILCNPDARISDVQALYNFLMHCVFDYRQQKCFLENNKTCKENKTSTITENETDRGIMALGGGTLAEIWKVNKKRRHLETLSKKQRTEASELYKLSLHLRVDGNEKKRMELPPSTIERDRGGFFIPKRQFHDFIAKTNEVVQNFMTEDCLKKYGKNLIKVCAVEVHSTLNLRHLFDIAASEVISTNFCSSVVDQFFMIWTRKMVHARINEFLTGYNQKKHQREKQRLKGGQTLRDKLFALTEKRKKSIKTPCVSRKSKTGQSKAKHSSPSCEPDVDTFKNEEETDTLLNKCLHNETTPGTKRRTLKPKRFLDFVCI